MTLYLEWKQVYKGCHLVSFQREKSSHSLVYNDVGMGWDKLQRLEDLQFGGRNGLALGVCIEDGENRPRNFKEKKKLFTSDLWHVHSKEMYTICLFYFFFNSYS